MLYEVITDYTNNGESLMVLTGFLDQLSAFVEASQKESQLKRAHINFTGGEPFLRKDFVELLKHARQKRYLKLAQWLNRKRNQP